MILSKTHSIIIACLSGLVAVGLIVGITIGIVFGKRKTETLTPEKQALEILKSNPLIDGHNDWAITIRESFRNEINNRDLYNMSQYPMPNSVRSHTDIARLQQGQVGGQFWSIYSDCQHQGKDATLSFLEQLDLMNRIIAKYPDVFQLTRSAQEVQQAFNAKRIASLLGVEGGHAIESSLSVLRIFYQLGVRYMTLTHNCNTPWIDQNQVDDINSIAFKNGGLTEFGRKIIKEMNRLGMLVDLSHVSKQSAIDVLNVTLSPVIFSHSSAYTLCNHTRNVQDDVLQLVKRNQGVVMVTFAPYFVTCDPANLGTVADVAAHINYIRNIAGVDNVGIGGDYDGIVVTPNGLEDVSKYPKLIEYLLSQGNWTDADIIKLIGGNILRVMEQNERIAQELQKTTTPDESLITFGDLEKHNLTRCRHLDMYR